MRSHDQGFIAAPPPAVYEALSQPETYARWWDGARAEGGEVEAPALDGSARMEGHREGLGLYLTSGDASLEWYLEPFEEGTIVNAFLDLPPSNSARGVLRRRWAIRRGLTGLKLDIEGAP
jgi:hypothetical protein